MSEKSIARQQPGRVRRAKNEPSAPSSLDGACSGDKFVVSKAGDVYDAPESEPNRKSRLKMIRKRDYSQFPAYEGERFRGLLTENGITRWLAQHVDTKFSLIELEDVSVKEVLQNVERLKTYHFAATDSRVDDIELPIHTIELGPYASTGFG